MEKQPEEKKESVQILPSPVSEDEDGIQTGVQQRVLS